MKYFLGADGGGTKTRAVCIDEKKKVLARFETGASNPYTVGFNKSAELLSSFIYDINEKYELSGAVLGIAGCANRSVAKKLMNKIKIRFEFPIEIKGDIEIAHYSAFTGRDGALLITGTGSVIYLKRGDSFTKIGGYGKIIGDEGSAYSFARKGFSGIAKIIDGRLNDKLLYDVADKLDLLQRDKLIHFVSSENIAQYAMLFIECAIRGSKFCMQILEEETAEVATLIDTASKKYSGNKLPIVFSGGLSNNLFYIKLIKKKIKNSNRLIFNKARYTPEYGAALIAFKLFKDIK